MFDKLSAIRYSRDVYALNHHMSTRDKITAAMELVTAWYPAKAVSQITGLSVRTVEREAGKRGLFLTDSEKFNPDTLDALAVLLVQYRDDSTVNTTLVKRIVAWGTSYSAIVAFTGIPLEDLRGE